MSSPPLSRRTLAGAGGAAGRDGARQPRDRLATRRGTVAEVEDPLVTKEADLVADPGPPADELSDAGRRLGEAIRRQDRADLVAHGPLERLDAQLLPGVVPRLGRQVDEQHGLFEAEREVESGTGPVRHHDVRVDERLALAHPLHD